VRLNPVVRRYWIAMIKVNHGKRRPAGLQRQQLTKLSTNNTSATNHYELCRDEVISVQAWVGAGCLKLRIIRRGLLAFP
jgi:hypothetical protein